MINCEGIKLGSIMMWRNCSQETFISSISDTKEDTFARTFVAKANMQKIWDQCMGMYADTGELMGAIIVTISKRSPKIANLQLLHTFTKYRRRGVASSLVQESYLQIVGDGASYFRVSSEPSAVPFYMSLGIRFWGLQKSGCSLSLFRIAGGIHEGIYDDCDPIIRKGLYSKRKGSLVSSSSFISPSTLF